MAGLNTRDCLAVLVAGLLAFPASGLKPARAEGQSTAAAVVSALFKSGRGQPADLSGASLAGLDLSGVDFKGAKLRSADLFGADLAGSNLKGADLAAARLDRAILTATDFSGANLEGATVLSPTIFTDIEQYRREAPQFQNARLLGAALSGHFDWANFTRANLAEASFGPRNDRDETQNARRSSLVGANFTEAVLSGVRLAGLQLKFGKFRGADVRGVDFRNANLTLADFSGADVTDADFTGADVYEANFTGAKGLDKARGLTSAVNADRIVRN